MSTIREPFKPNSFYHMLNHAPGDEALFREEKNFYYFLKLYNKYIPPIADTYGFCLMPNHFHLVVQIKDIEFKNSKKTFSGEVSHHFGTMQNAYAKAVNKVYSRRGPLFCQSIHRRELDNENYINNAIRYVHLNPQLHGFVASAEDWMYSSYNTYLDNKNNSKKLLDILKYSGTMEQSEHQAKACMERYALEMDLFY